MKDIKRNSVDMVEAAFDGDLEGVKKWLEKGFWLESTDPHDHTALSEAACQGQDHVIRFLIESGANPNLKSDTGRTPMYRAAFNGHIATLQLLLECGGDPHILDKSGEGPYDVAKDEDTRKWVQAVNREDVQKYTTIRKAHIDKKMEERIKTTAEREAWAKLKLRDELIEKTLAGDAEGVKYILLDMAREADNTGQRPRATAQVRGQKKRACIYCPVENEIDCIYFAQ